ncbi:MAG: tetratricopeptide repeat protein [Terriglobia bacterium]
MDPLPSSTRFSQSSRWSTSHLLLVAVLAAAVPYVSTLMNGFVYDDLTQVMNNPYVVNFHHLRQIFSTGVWSYIGRQGVTNYYRPMMTFGYLLCYQVFGKVAFGYHLVNVSLHVAVVCALFGLTLTLFGRRDIALVTALIFALHPVHTESVAWIAAVTDVELTLFYILTFWLFVSLARPGGSRSPLAFAGMVVCFILALLSKEQALTLPLLATLYEHSCREDRASTTGTQKLARYGVLWLLAGGYVLVRTRLLGALAPVNQMPALTWPQAFLSAFALTGHYVEKMFWPLTLCAFYVFHKSTSLANPRVIAGLAVMVASVMVFLALWKRARLASLGLLWFFVTLAPVLNARWMAANVFAERYLYLPSAGFCWVLGWCGVTAWAASGNFSRRLQRALEAGFVALLVLSVVRVAIRNRDWNNDVRLYTRTLAQQPDAYQIRNNLGTVYWRQGKAAAAVKEWKEALKLHPRNAIVLSNLGLFYASKEDYARAVEYFRQAMQLKPAYTDPHLNLGETEEKMRQLQAAELQFSAAVALAPLNVRAHNDLGKVYCEKGEDAQAERQFRLSARSNPNSMAFDQLGALYARGGGSAEAVQAYEKALALNSYDSVAHFGLAAIYSAWRLPEKAEKEYESGLRTDPRNLEAAAALRQLRQDKADGTSKGN